MARLPLLVSTVLSLTCLCFTCVMLAGNSGDKSVLQQAAWGRVASDQYYLGTTAIVKNEDYDGFEFIGELENYLNDGTLPEACLDAGKISIAMTALLFILTLVLFVVSVLRLRESSSEHLMKVTGIMAANVAMLCNVMAVYLFDRKCLASPEMAKFGAEPGVAMQLGFCMIFLLAACCNLHTIASTGGAGECTGTPGQPSLTAGQPRRPLLHWIYTNNNSNAAKAQRDWVHEELPGHVAMAC